MLLTQRDVETMGSNRARTKEAREQGREVGKGRRDPEKGVGERDTRSCEDGPHKTRARYPIHTR